MVIDPVSALCGLEPIEAVAHDDGSGLSVVSGPSTEARADPCGEGEEAFRMGVLPFFGVSFKGGTVLVFEDMVAGPCGVAVAVLDHPHAGDAGNEGLAHSVLKGAVSMETFSMPKSLGLDWR